MCYICDAVRPYDPECGYNSVNIPPPGENSDPVGPIAAPGNIFVAGLVGNDHWSETPQPVLSWAMSDGGLSDYNYFIANSATLVPFSPGQANHQNLESGGGNPADLRADVRAAFDAFEDVTGATFNEFSNFQGSGVDFRLMSFNNLTGLNGIATFPGSDPSPDSFEAFILYNNNNSGMANTAEQGAATNREKVAIHEIMHSLGIGHPQDTGNGSGTWTSGAILGDNVLDNDRYTVMSAERGGLEQNTQNRTFGYSATPMALDVAALQYMYGSSSNHTGNTVYRLTDPGAAALDLEGDGDNLVSIGRAFYTIWDTAGTDEIRYDGTRNVLLNLNEATMTQGADPAAVARVLADLSGSSLINTILPLATASELRNDLFDADYHAGGFFSRIFSNGGAADLGGYSIASDIYADAGDTTIIENATGNSGTDVLVGNEQDNVLDGETGNDLLAGGDGNDTLIGGNGNDELLGGNGNDSLNGGNEPATGGDGVDTLDGGSGNDTLVGGFSTDSIQGGSGNDLIRVDAGQFMDSVDGGTGSDTLDHSALTENGLIIDFDGGTLSGFGGGTVTNIETYLDGSGSNTITDRSGAMTINAGAGNDVVNENVSGGSDNFDLGSGNDTLNIFNTGIGGDTFDGGSGIDLIDFSNVTFNSGTVIDLAMGTLSLGGASETISNFENANGSMGNDSIIGTSGNNVIDGGDGDDTIGTLTNQGGSDDISGGAGNDRILRDVGNGEDTYDGGTGNDTAVIQQGTVSTARMNLATGYLELGANLTFEQWSNFENFDASGSSSSASALGTSGANSILGGNGSSTLDGAAGNDTIVGNDGNDTLIGGSGNDLMQGGFDNDSLMGDSGADTLNGGAGDDTVMGGSGIDVLRGGSGDDLINGGTSTDIINGDNGNDTIQITGSDFLDQVNGGAGTDLLDMTGYLTSGLFVDLGGFTYGSTSGSSPQAIVNVENVFGSGNADLLTGNTGRNWLVGGGGNDTLNGGLGDDTVNGGGGNDFVSGGAGGDVLNGSAGNDTLSYASDTTGVDVRLFNGFASGGDATGDNISNFENLRGGSGNDTLFGNTTNNLLQGADGDDEIFGTGGNDTLNGGNGADTLNGGTGNNTLAYTADTAGVEIRLNINFANGGEATGDSIANFDNVISGSGGDRLFGNSNANRLVSRDGDDTINGGAGADTMFGGAGTDLLSYITDTTGVDVRLFNGFAAGGDATGDSFTGFENLLGGSGNDTLFGDSGDNLLQGAGGNDELFGTNGNDTLAGGAGGDTLNGGGGNNTLSYEGDSAGVHVRLFSGFAAGGDATGDSFSNFDNLLGGSGNDTLYGNTNDNLIVGGGGNDLIFGTNGNDTLEGGAGGDTINGGGGNNTLSYESDTSGVEIRLFNGLAVGGDATGDSFSNVQNVTGGSGNDRLFGDGGDNILAGGTGNDTLSALGGDDTFVLADGFGTDVIVGFESSNAEDIDLSAVTNITDFTDLVNNHLVNSGGFARIVDGGNSVLLQGVNFADVGVGQLYSADDFIF